MLKSLKIENFRGFKKFELNELGRINLLVGTNNSGKTSILEALQIYFSRLNYKSLGEIMYRRGEIFKSNGISDDDKLLIEICHLFYGRKLATDNQVSLIGINEKLERLVMFVDSDPFPELDFSRNDIELENEWEKTILLTRSIKSKQNKSDNLYFWVQWYIDNKIISNSLRLLSFHGVLNISNRADSIYVSDQEKITAQFVTSSSLTVERMVELFNEIVLNPEEKLIYEALQIIEPRIERIAPISSDNDFRGGFLVRLSDSEQRIPIGSMGEGIWRMLGLALALVSAKGGVLLVDDIDTGLHFSVMSNMWKLIWETAKKLDVQVFATTHNSDCWTSLASLANQEDMTEDGITIHRIEPGKETSIVFTKSEIVIAAERGIEVR